jgi:hypothetical protein
MADKAGAGSIENRGFYLVKENMREFRSIVIKITRHTRFTCNTCHTHKNPFLP